MGYTVCFANNKGGVGKTTTSVAIGLAWARMGKKVLFDFSAGFNNYEGMCLGPRLSDKALSVVLVTDAGDGRTAPSILPLVLDLSAKRSE